MTAEALAAAPHFVYRFRDSDGALLYIGCTSDVRHRISCHSSTQWWYPLVASATMQGPFSRLDGLRRERQAIAAECPRFNRQHNPNPCPALPAEWVTAAKRHVAEGLPVSFPQALRFVAVGTLPIHGPLTNADNRRMLDSLPGTRRGYELLIGILARATDAALREYVADGAAA